MRVCRTCLKEKPIDSFSVDKRWKGTYKLDCKSCTNEKKRLKYDPHLRRIEGLKNLYGISYEDLCTMYTQQNGCCSICSTPISLEAGRTKKGKAHVDHCHATGKVRGLLCTKCNTLLGMAEDSIDILKAAILYLDRSQDD